MKKKTKDLEEGDIIWNPDTDFGDGEKKIHPNLIVEDKSYAMTSSKDQGDNTRVQYNINDLNKPPALGTNITGKYVTNIEQNLTKEEYIYYAKMKRSFIIKFKNWLSTGKFE